MTYTLVVLDAVTDELQEATLYYESKQSNLGIKLLADWDNTLAALQKNPLGYEKKYKGYRQIQLKKFPYLIVFEIETSTIVVYRFINAHKHPNKRYK